jgi:ClpP class serine protease
MIPGKRPLILVTRLDPQNWDASMHAAILERLRSAPLAVDFPTLQKIRGRLLNKLATSPEKPKGLKWPSPLPGAHLAVAKNRQQFAHPAFIVDNVAIVPIVGVIVDGSSPFEDLGFHGATFLDDFLNTFQAMLADPKISAIVLSVDSPGGGVYGVQEAADVIYAAKKVKPVQAVNVALAASAAYWLAASAQKLIVQPSSESLSIGVYQLHVDQSGMLDQLGLSVTLIASNPEKVAGHPYGPLDIVGRASLEKAVTDYYGKFIRAVARGRNVSLTAVRSGYLNGDVARAEEAVTIGAADRIGTIAEVVNAWLAAKPKSGKTASTFTDSPSANNLNGGPRSADFLRRRMQVDETERQCADWQRNERNAADLAGIRQANADAAAQKPIVRLSAAELRQEAGITAPAPPDWGLCYHEAGHAAAFCMFGFTPEYATVVANETSRGHVMPGAIAAPAGIKAVVSHCGYLASERFANHDGGSCDRTKALAAVGGNEHSNADAYRRAQQFVGKCADLIRIIARELHEHRTLSGARIAQLCHDHGPAFY